MESILKESGYENIHNASFIKLKYKNEVKRLPQIPKNYEELHSFVKSKISPFKEGQPFNLYYFDDENESITISDECDY